MSATCLPLGAKAGRGHHGSQRPPLRARRPPPGAPRPRADELSTALGVSVRTLYRDVAALRAMGVPVDGAAGVGYRLASEGDLPAVAFTGAELEALALGARLVATWADPDLAAAARSAVARIEAALPQALRSVLMDVPLYAPSWRAPEPPAALGLVRQATVAGLWLDVEYVDLRGVRSTRRVRPLSLHFWGQVWTLGAWCELRQGFRAFRVDLIEAATQGPPFPVEPGRGREDLFRHYLADTALNGFLVAARWADEDNWPRTEAAYFGAMPTPLRWILPGRLRAGVLKILVARDIWRAGPAACWARYEQLLDSLDARAPLDGFWIGPKLGVADVALFAQLHGLRTRVTPGQRASIAARPRLSAWLDRVDAATA